LSWVYVVPTLLMAGRIVIMRSTDPELVCSVIQSERCTTGPIMPVTVARIAEVNRNHAYDLSSFRSDVTADGWSEMTRPGPRSAGWGMTETAGPVLIARFAGAGSSSICGRPAPFASVRIVDPDFEEVDAGAIGQLAIAGPVLFEGYWNRPELNARRFRDGYFLTGDLGRMDPDGTISFVGTGQRMIRTGHENVYPAEVESVIRDFPGVAEAAVLGRPDDTWGQSVVAVVAGDGLDVSILSEFVRDRLAHYKAPKEYVLAAALPKTAAGLVDREAIDATYGGGNYPGSA
jgi:long-chain acyl-CoA synthetase